MPWLVRLYLLGLLLSAFSALLGLVDFLGDLSGQRSADGARTGITIAEEARAGKAFS